MAKKEKYYIARWVETNPGGGVSMIGFVEYMDEVIRDQRGRTKTVPATTPTPLTIKAVPGEDGAEIKYGKDIIELDQGEFIVQNNKINVNKLKQMCKLGQVEMRDLDLHYEFIGEEAPDEGEAFIPIEERGGEPAPLSVGELEQLTCVKINRDIVLKAIYMAGYETLEELSKADASSLTDIKGVAEKSANNIISEAQELLEV